MFKAFSLLHRTKWLINYSYGFPGGSAIKNMPTVQERQRWVPSLGGEDVLEEVMKVHSSILVWRIPWTEESGGIQS